MTVLSIACDNCGAKYKLPETFAGTQAKCQKCGSVIDVQKQRTAAGAAPAAAARPATAMPAAAARPAVDRSKSEPKPKVERPARAARADRGKATDTDGGGDKPAGARSERGARGERAAAKKSNVMPLALAGIGLVAVVVVVLVTTMGGKEPAKDQTAKTDGTAQAAQKPVEPAAATPPADVAPAVPAAGEPKTGEPKTGEPKAAEPAPTDASAPPAPAAPPAEPGRPLRAFEKITGVTTLAQVTDPKTYPEVAWPAAIDDARKAEIRGLCEDVKNGGRAGIRAKPKLVENGWASLFGIVETLRMLDYTTETGNEHAFEFHKMLEEMTAGQGTGFEQVAIGEPIDPRKAEFNARTVKAWRSMLDRYPDEAAFKKAIAERKKKQADADK